MDVADVRKLLAYGAWANARIFDAASELSEEQWTREVGGSYPSLAGTLRHIVGAEWVWLQRLLGASHGMPEWTKTAGLQELRETLAEVEHGRDTFVSGLTREALVKSLAYRNLAGQPYTRLIGDILIHVVNHSTYHRGQATSQLRALGVKPPFTDYIYFV
jgi:uncharacterized damage-inducible protein DinB